MKLPRSQCLLAVVVCLQVLASHPLHAAPKAFNVYVGTYTDGKTSKGIYLYRLDLGTGALTATSLAAEIESPSFLAVHPSQKTLYAVNEVSKFDGKSAGAASAFAIDAATGKLSLLNQQTSGGPGPCHVTVDPSGKALLLANYGGGSVESLPIAADGKLGDPASFHQHKGSSANPGRQEAPHAHSINVDPSGKFAVAADLGLDQVVVYRLDAAKGTLTDTKAPAKLKPGSGPRHFAFHPSGRFAYVINELVCTVTAFSWDQSQGVLKEIETVTTLPEPFKDGYSTAEVQVHPSGKFLYGSNRGHHSIAVFSIDAATGKLTAVENESTRGKTPRGFGIDPTGAYLLAGNQDSNTIAVFRIDARSGKLEPVGEPVAAPKPVCIKFVATE